MWYRIEMRPFGLTRKRTSAEIVDNVIPVMAVFEEGRWVRTNSNRSKNRIYQAASTDDLIYELENRGFKYQMLEKSEEFKAKKACVILTREYTSG